MSKMTDSTSSSTESSESDWCFVGKQSASSLIEASSEEAKVDTNQVKNEIKEDVVTENDSQERSKLNDIATMTCSVVENDGPIAKKKDEGILETSEVHSDSSSDIDILDEFDSLNVSGNIHMCSYNQPLELNIRHDPPPLIDNLPDADVSMDKIPPPPQMIDKEIQSPSPESSMLDPVPEQLENASENEDSPLQIEQDILSIAALPPLEIIDRIPIKFHLCEKHATRKARLISAFKKLRADWPKMEVFVILGLLLSLTFCCAATFMTVFSTRSISNQRSDSLRISLAKMQNSLVLCFGEQQLEALKTNDAELLSSIHCMHNYEHYKKEFEACLTKEVVMFLQNPEDVLKSLAENYPDINLPMIIHQLQYLELLPISNENEIEEDIPEFFDPDISFEVFKEMRDIIENLTLVNQQLRSQISSYNEKTGSINSDDFIIAKDIKNVDNDENLANDIIIKELKIKMTWLHLENEQLQKEIDELRELQKSRSYCYNDKSENTFEEEPFKKYTEKNEETAEKLKPYLDDLVSTLSSQIVNLHTSLANELKEVKRYNELIRNMTMEIRNKSSSSTENDSYSWQQLRENVESIVSEAHQDLKEKISAFQTLNFTDAFNNALEDNKKNAEYMLNIINQYVGVVKEKTQEFLENPIPQIDKDTTINGFWNIMNNLQDQWHYVKGTVKKIAKKFHPKKDHNFEKNAKKSSHHEPEGPSGDWYIKRSEARRNYHNVYDDRFSKSNWLFQRAAQRKRIHKKWQKDES